MQHDSWNTGFHLRSPRAWLNDPNGCCQFRGRYHFYYQYNPQWPERDQKAWGAFSSDNLLDWTFDGAPIVPDVPADRHGVYTGSALVERGTASDGGDTLRVFYTGNVLAPGPDHNPRDIDCVFEGREASQVTCTSEDGASFSPKQVVIPHTAYPDHVTTHVRDPKVWREDGSLHMLLGARHSKNDGMCLLYDSASGTDWELRHEIRPHAHFGYMWECPNTVRLGGHDYLAVSPQGLPTLYDRWQNLWQAGYFPLPGHLLDTTEVDERTFVEWDHGHDFYAPQTFEDESGRQILVGWLGTFSPDYTAVPDGLGWCHCLTVPRLLTRDADTGLIVQNPVPELLELRQAHQEVERNVELTVFSRMADIELRGIRGRMGEVTLDGSFQVSYTEGTLSIRYLDARAAAGRQDRYIPLASLTDLRILVDGSVVEVYVNGGREVFSCRWFPHGEDALRILSTLDATEGHAWEMEDRMAQMYATAIAPDLEQPGRLRRRP